MTVTKKASAKEIVMLIFACVILILPMFLFLPIVIPYPQGDSSTAPIPGVEFLAFIFLLYTVAVGGIIMCAAIIIAWSVGLILSVKLALRKNRIPRWMYITSLVLTSLYLAGFIALILVWIIK